MLAAPSLCSVKRRGLRLSDGQFLSFSTGTFAAVRVIPQGAVCGSGRAQAAWSCVMGAGQAALLA